MTVIDAFLNNFADVFSLFLVHVATDEPLELELSKEFSFELQKLWVSDIVKCYDGIFSFRLTIENVREL